jgi:uncharacterized membrane protein YvbJ
VYDGGLNTTTTKIMMMIIMMMTTMMIIIITIIIIIIINGEMEHSASAEIKAGSNAVTTHSDTKRNIPGGLSLSITLLYSTYNINTRAEHS